jgi:hypothetical protein
MGATTYESRVSCPGRRGLLLQVSLISLGMGVMGLLAILE